MATVHYNVRDLIPYISWSYFFHAWSISARFNTVVAVHDCPACRTTWLHAFEETDREQAKVAMELYDDALRMLNDWDAQGYRTHARFALFPAWADGDDLLLGEHRLPLLRQQSKAPNADTPYLCLSDYVRPLGSALPTTDADGRPHVAGNVGIFATTIDAEMEHLHDEDPYLRMLTQTLCDRLAEATAERVHLDIRREHWGYAPEEKLSVADLLVEKYQGIRPAVGYPSLPDQSIIFLLDEWLDMRGLGIHLTESGAMLPHASVCGLIFAHPAAQYFAVGKIDEEQLADYARRRGMTVETLRRFLVANLRN